MITKSIIRLIRNKVIAEAKKCLGVPYEYGAEWKNYEEMPISLDCSEFIEGIFNVVSDHLGLKKHLHMPDGSYNQYQATIPVSSPVPADLCFFGKEKKASRIYHVGMLFNKKDIIEARGFQKDSSFETGKVILRHRENWENYKNFLGYRQMEFLLVKE